METKLQVITLKQLPIIEEHLQLVKADVETRTKNAMQLVCTEETRGDVKKIRTELGKEFASMEEQRKRVKEAIMEPYNQFEAVYKDCISDPYKKADAELKRRIDEVEAGLKADKVKAVQSYFDELCKANNLPWLRFEQMNLKIGLSTSVNGTKTALTSTVLKIAEEVQELSRHDDAAELLVEYKKSLNVALALSTVRARHAMIELQKQRVAERRAALEQQQAAEEMLIAFVEGVSEHLPDIMLAAASIVETLLTYFIEHLPDIVEGAMQMGDAVIDGIIDGISAAWDSLVSWFNGLWNNLFGNRSVNVDVNSSGTDGSHAGGLDYVPYDNYIANLHRGEMVLTSAEATQYRKGNENAAGGMTINIDINGIQFSDVNSMAHALANQISYELQAQSNRKAAVYA